MFRKIVCLMLVVLMAVGVCACGAGGGGTDTPGVNNNGDGGNGGGDNVDVGSLDAGKWPTAVYSKYGIDEIKTDGKIVYTEFPGEAPYEYGVYYSGVTRDELVEWTDGLFAEGFRAADRDKDRLKNNSYEYDLMIYCAEEKQPYRMRISFDFDDGMEFEYYDEDDHGFTVVEEKDEYGDTHRYIRYNLKITLNALTTAEEYEGEFPSLGLKAEDLKGVSGVRRVDMGEADYMSAINFKFYSDHVTTEEEINACRELLIDKLAENGAKFYDGLDKEKEMTADELKESGKSSYYVENGEKMFMLMVNTDSAYGDFGDFYGLILTKSN